MHHVFGINYVRLGVYVYVGKFLAGIIAYAKIIDAVICKNMFLSVDHKDLIFQAKSVDIDNYKYMLDLMGISWIYSVLEVPKLRIYFLYKEKYHIEEKQFFQNISGLYLHSLGVVSCL